MVYILILPEKPVLHAGIIHLGKKGFYQDVGNTPDWFPKNISFRALTRKHGIQYMTAVTVYNIITVPIIGDEGKYKVQQMQEILQAFLDNCTDHYKM